MATTNKLGQTIYEEPNGDKITIGNYGLIVESGGDKIVAVSIEVIHNAVAEYYKNNAGKI